MNFFLSNALNSISFDFVRFKKFSLFLSILLVSISIFSVYTKGINFGIDFTGGIAVQIQSDQEIDLNQIKSHISNEQQLSLQSLYYLENKNSAVLKIKPSNGSDDVKILKKAFKDCNFFYQKMEYIGPQISRTLIKKGFLAFFSAVIAIFFYLLIRFNTRVAFGGIASLLHDAAVVCGIYSFFFIEFRVSSVAALLTIIGYSINDSVVIFDRIREGSTNAKDATHLINISINKTLSRTIFTSLTTAAAVLPIIFIASGEIVDFAKIILAGVVVGTYSSIFISAPMTVVSLNFKK